MSYVYVNKVKKVFQLYNYKKKLNVFTVSIRLHFPF